MLLAAVLLLFGAVLVAVGAEGAVRFAGRLALAAGIPAFALGALLFGIDVEGLGAALLAAGRGQTGIAAGEAFGTALFVASLAFGLALLVSPRPVESPSVPMLLAPALPLAAAGLALFDGSVGRADGAVLVGLYGAYVTVVVTEHRAVADRAREIEREVAEAGSGRARLLAMLGASLAAVFAGAWSLVEGGVRILERTGLRAGYVGVAVVATLASLDEIFLEVVPVRRGEPALATGNLMGTVAAFPSAVLGLAALVRPLPADATANLALVAAAGLYTAITVAFLIRGRAGRGLGLVLVAAYPAWLALTSGL